jgi:hypothetical protein
MPEKCKGKQWKAILKEMVKLIEVNAQCKIAISEQISPGSTN